MFYAAVYELMLCYLYNYCLLFYNKAAVWNKNRYALIQTEVKPGTVIMLVLSRNATLQKVAVQLIHSCGNGRYYMHCFKSIE